jgi:dTDP-glucose 4,6-dehydratase
MIFVTGGAGFIGANFVHDWLAAEREGVLVIDKLTYAGNLDNLAKLRGDPRFEALMDRAREKQLACQV